MPDKRMEQLANLSKLCPDKTMDVLLAWMDYAKKEGYAPDGIRNYFRECYLAGFMKASELANKP